MNQQLEERFEACDEDRQRINNKWLKLVAKHKVEERYANSKKTEENKKDISNKEDEEDNEKINVTHDQRTTDYLNKYLPLAQNAFDVFLL